MSYPLPPHPAVVLDALYRLGLPRAASDAALRGALCREGIDPTEPYGRRIVEFHEARRYEHLTGHPF